MVQNSIYSPQTRILSLNIELNWNYWVRLQQVDPVISHIGRNQEILKSAEPVPDSLLSLELPLMFREVTYFELKDGMSILFFRLNILWY